MDDCDTDCITVHVSRLKHGAGKMTQWVEVLAVKPDDLSSIPGSQMMEEENHLPQVVL